MSALSQVMLWATRINAKTDAQPHQILDVKIDATIEDAQEAFHKIARIAHPDLHRTTLSPEDLELVTRAYARAAGAYQDFRNQRMATTRMKPVSRDSTPIPVQRATGTIPTQRATGPIPTQRGTGPTTGTIPTQRGSGPIPTAAPGPTTPPTGTPTAGASAAAAMSSKALIYYRKAELSLRRGDLKGAILQLKMAIAADPQSALLRTALAEVESEVAKTP